MEKTLIKRKPKPQPVEAEELVEASTEDLLEMLRDGIRIYVQEGMQSHEAQDAKMALLKLVDELDLAINPRKEK